jgi:hypothetical protein
VSSRETELNVADEGAAWNKIRTSVIYSSKCELSPGLSASTAGVGNHAGKPWVLDNVVAALRALTGQCRQRAVPPGPVSTRGRPAGRPLSTSDIVACRAGRGLQQKASGNELQRS